VPGPEEATATPPHIARVYDYLLGGTSNFAADRAVGDQLVASLPAVQIGVRAQRDLLGRVVRYLVGEAGIRQLLDIGSGLPTAENVHETRTGSTRRLGSSTSTTPPSSCRTPKPSWPATR
jgi:S-adenosyl methyltransferase